MIKREEGSIKESDSDRVDLITSVEDRPESRRCEHGGFKQGLYHRSTEGTFTFTLAY